MRCHFISNKVAPFPKTQWVLIRLERTWSVKLFLWESKMACFGKLLDISSKCKHCMNIWWNFSISIIYLREIKTYIHEKSCTQMFIAVLFIFAVIWGGGSLECISTDKWINIMWFLHPWNIYPYSVNEILINTEDYLF